MLARLKYWPVNILLEIISREYSLYINESQIKHCVTIKNKLFVPMTKQMLNSVN